MWCHDLPGKPPQFIEEREGSILFRAVKNNGKIRGDVQSVTKVRSLKQ